MSLLCQTKVRSCCPIIPARVDLRFGDGFAGRDGESSSVTYPPNTKCTFTLWAPGHTPKRSVQLSILEEFSSVEGFCRVMRVEVSLPPTRDLRCGALIYCQPRFDTKEFTTAFSM